MRAIFLVGVWLSIRLIEIEARPVRAFSFLPFPARQWWLCATNGKVLAQFNGSGF